MKRRKMYDVAKMFNVVIWYTISCGQRIYRVSRNGVFILDFEHNLEDIYNKLLDKQNKGEI